MFSRNKLPLWITLVATSLLISSVASAQTTWIVDKGGGGDFSTIQGCIGDDEVLEGDICLVNPDTYVENIDCLGKNITVRSVLGPEETVIDGNYNGSVVTFKNGESQDAVIDGFEIQNGTGTLYPNPYPPPEEMSMGGGIFVIDSSSATITNSVITGNTAELGGGITIGNSSSS